MIKRSSGEHAFDVFNTLFMLVVIFITLYPFLHVAFASFSAPEEIAKNRGIMLWPRGFSVQGYREVFQNPMIVIGYRNTILYVVVGTAINILMTSLGAYVLSRKGYLYKNYLMFFIVFTMFFEGGLIPTFLLIRSLGIYNTMWAIVLPVAISTWNLIVMRTYFQGIPDSMEESAKIDGASHITILFRVILPLSKPILAVMVLFYGVGHWNSWFSAMIYLRERTKFPLQLVLREILISASMRDVTSADLSLLERQRMYLIIRPAVIMIATVPILFLYPFLQKYFVKGVMIGALKG